MFQRIIFACISVFAVAAISGCSHEQVKEEAAPAPAPAPVVAPAPAPAPAPGTCATDADCNGKGRCMHGACR